MTDKDMLIFNPNYQAFLEKLKSKESKSSELSRIMSQPYNEAASKLRKKKQETVLYAYVRETKRGQSLGNTLGGDKAINASYD